MTALKDIHKKIEKISEEYKKETGEESCISSTSYLELISTYESLVSEKHIPKMTVESNLI